MRQFLFDMIVPSVICGLFGVLPCILMLRAVGFEVSSDTWWVMTIVFVAVAFFEAAVVTPMLRRSHARR